MLVLTCKKTAVVVIGNPEHPIGRVTVLEIRGALGEKPQVRLGFDFPKSIEVNREEVLPQKAEGKT